MRSILVAAAFILFVQTLGPASANSKSPCVAQSITYNFILMPTKFGDPSTQYHKEAQVIIDFAPSPNGDTTTCVTPASVPSPHPLTRISVIIDGFQIDIPDHCLEGSAWPIESVHMNSFKEEVHVEITTTSTATSNGQVFLGLALDPEPGGSAWHKKNDMPPVMCYVWPEGSKVHG